MPLKNIKTIQNLKMISLKILSFFRRQNKTKTNQTAVIFEAFWPFLSYFEAWKNTFNSNILDKIEILHIFVKDTFSNTFPLNAVKFDLDKILEVDWFLLLSAHAQAKSNEEKCPIIKRKSDQKSVSHKFFCVHQLKMPIRGSKNIVSKENERRKEDMLRRIKEAAIKDQNGCPPIVIDESSSEDENDDEIRQQSLKTYKRMIDQTMDLPLEKLIMNPEGVDVFDELCLRLDINQNYAELLPQWTDVAHQLEMDVLRTKWVEVCVRPREGLTRAM